MTRFTCAVADCQSCSTFSEEQYPFMQYVKGWAKFPSKKEENRRRMWEMRCKRDRWRASRNHAICSRHFVAWEDGKPSPEHPDPVLFQYNGWDWERSRPRVYSRRRENGGQGPHQQHSTTQPDTTSTSQPQQLDITHSPFTHSTEEMLYVNESVQDWCEAEVCSDEHNSTSINTKCAVAATPAPHINHSYDMGSGKTVDPVSVGVQVELLQTKSSDKSSDLQLDVAGRRSRRSDPSLLVVDRGVVSLVDKADRLVSYRQGSLQVWKQLGGRQTVATSPNTSQIHNHYFFAVQSQICRGL